MCTNYETFIISRKHEQWIATKPPEVIDYMTVSALQNLIKEVDCNSVYPVFGTLSVGGNFSTDVHTIWQVLSANMLSIFQSLTPAPVAANIQQKVMFNLLLIFPDIRYPIFLFDICY